MRVLAGASVLGRPRPLYPLAHVALVAALVGAVLAAPVSPAATASAAAPAASGPNPRTCEGYPEKRVFLESQSWWTRTPGRSGTDFGHVHLGTCFPWAQQLSGTVTFDVRVILHDNPGRVYNVSTGALTGRGGTGPTGVNPQFTCDAGGTDPHQTCERWVRLTLDTRRAPADGRAEFRFHVDTREPDGKRNLVSTGWQAYLRNGKPVSDYRSSDGTIARGWYEGSGYENASIRELPTAPVRGVWRPYVRLNPGAGGIPVTAHSVHVDPNFHAGNPGLVVKQGPGPFRGALAIDTTRLANGPHRLLLKSDADASSGSTLSGALMITFEVAN